MASGAAALALKAAVVTAVLAVLVLPSSGRCPSLGPEAPVALALAPGPEPVAASAPAPGTPISCANCSSQCQSACNRSFDAKCGQYCYKSDCAYCTHGARKQCEVDCCSTGTCGTCNCDLYVEQRCASACSERECWDCRKYEEKQCVVDCNSECHATCV